MNIIRYRLALIVMLIMYAANSSAQFDPTLTTMIAVYKNKAEKQLKSQQAAMGMETAGHMKWKQQPRYSDYTMTIWIRSKILSAMQDRYTDSM